MNRQTPAIRENVFYSVLDYVSQPAMMLIAAPLLLRALGVQQYGTWMLVNSIAATASGLGGGFGDGATRYVSMYRGSSDRAGAARSLMSVLLVNCGLGLASAVVMIAAAPWLIGHAFTVEPSLRHAGIMALRISAALLTVRFAEAVFMAALRGCERYKPMVAVSVAARTLGLALALALALSGRGLVAILWASLAAGIASAAAQAWLAFRAIGADAVWRGTQLRDGVREVFSFGAYTWLKSTLGVLVGYADRLLVAAILGTGPLAFYALCNQLTQPIHTVIASAFNFVFPNFSAQSASGRWAATRRSYRIAAGIAATIVGAMCFALIFGAKLVLRLWLGAEVAAQYHDLLIVMTIGNGLLALSVVPHYAALALGRSRALVVVSFLAGAVSLGCGYFLMHRTGLMGAGLARIAAGAIFLWTYRIVRRAFIQEQSTLTSGETAGTATSALTFAQ